MLETDPTKRPDIYQVSHLVFSLAERSCPIKNHNVRIPLKFEQIFDFLKRVGLYFYLCCLNKHLIVSVAII